MLDSLLGITADVLAFITGTFLGLLLSETWCIRPLKQRHEKQMNGLRSALLATLKRAEHRGDVYRDGWEAACRDVERAKKKLAERTARTRKLVKKAAKAATNGGRRR
jgi:hypothetical protein